MSSSRALLKSFAAAGVAMSLLAAPLAWSQTVPPAPMVAMPSLLTLTVSGDVSAAPDMATISFAVVTQGKTAVDAMKANNVRMNAVMSALKSSGIVAKDIQTSSLNLNPQYVYVEGQSPKLTGYEARNHITVRVNDLAKTGPVIDTVIGAGINQIDQISFGMKNDDALLDQARQKAVANLLQRADLYARATGMKIKGLVSLTEGGGNYQPPRPVMAFRKEAADSSTPISGGEVEQSVTITATYELTK